MKSPGESTRSPPIGSPSTTVPLVLPRSRIHQRPKGSQTISAWRRETVWWSRRSPTPGTRPITIGDSASTRRTVGAPSRRISSNARSGATTVSITGGGA